MSELRYTLLTDGSSDDALLPILSWLIAGHLPETAIRAQWADLRKLRRRPRDLSTRIREALDLYPCRLLFVHRDAEREPPASRVAEIRTAVAAVSGSPPHVCIVPVRMMEAWLLFDEVTLRRAAGNPNGRMPLELPPLRRLEEEPDPKERLRLVLREASGLSGRRLKRFHVMPRRVAALTDDFSPLRSLPAFQRLETDLTRVLADPSLANGDSQTSGVSRRI